jgi:hypothetical protein
MSEKGSAKAEFFKVDWCGTHPHCMIMLYKGLVSSVNGTTILERGLPICGLGPNHACLVCR